MNIILMSFFIDSVGGGGLHNLSFTLNLSKTTLAVSEKKHGDGQNRDHSSLPE